MDDLISRQAAKDVIANMEAVGYSPYATIGRLDALLALNRLPSAERRGRWKQVGDNTYRCSVCGELSCCCSPYCGECGAKMDEVLT